MEVGEESGCFERGLRTSACTHVPHVPPSVALRVWCGTERVHVRGCARGVLWRALVYSCV